MSNLPVPPGQKPPESPLSQPHKTKSVGELGEKTFASDVGGKSNWLLSALKFAINWIIIPLVIVFLFQAFVFQAFYVSGQSMEPTFQDGDYLVISKIGITSKTIRQFFNKNASLNYQRGDVLVFRPPIATSTFYIKRLIGLPGERVVLHDGKITIYNKEHPQGIVLKETYTDQAATTLGDLDVTVDKDKVFVFGDNREANASYDSRQWGQLPQYDITGRVIIRLLPINRFRWLVGHVGYSVITPFPIWKVFYRS